MATIRVFAIHTFISPTVRDALGLAPHARQARILIAAPSKAQAARLVEAVHRDQHGRTHIQDVPRAADREFRQAHGDDVDAIRDAGLLATPRVVAVPSLSTGYVASVDHCGVRRLGRLQRVDNGLVLDLTCGDHRAADLPYGSVVATDRTVWFAARDPDDAGPRWDGLLGAEVGDDEIDRLLDLADGKLLRYGVG